MGRFCQNCGASQSDTAKFCASCGAQVLDVAVPLPNYQSHYEPQLHLPVTAPAKKKPLYKRWWFWLIVVFAVGIIGNIVQLLGGQGDNGNSSTGNVVLSGSTSTSKTVTSGNRQQVSQQQVEFALNEYDVYENSTVIIISHNINSLIDNVSYKRTAQYKYMDLETTGIVSFKYNPDTNEWQRYPAGDSIFTQEEKWNVNGEWVFYESFGTTSSGNQHFIDFKINIRKIDPDTPENYGMLIVCDVFYNGSLHFALRDIFEEYSYNAYLKKGEKVVGRHSFEIKENWPHITKLTIILDKDEGVSLGVSSPGNYRSCPCERK
ncbi:MAG: zinc ribbon domain-containing protein [Oscillospiraceae bacterium]|jgi:hypothetical protein|nr:zinc ribbon domain-containing protein [Oscillospiraceae bacterium]